MSKWTKGPWKVLEYMPTKKYCSVFVLGTFRNKKEVEANVRLIASAPELLEALKLWTLFWDKMPKGQLGKIVCDIGILNEAFIKTRRAIAKAEEVK